jgi:pimeloyl-ACP methyl ester carboxylesterase
VLLHDLGDPDAGRAWRAAAPSDWIIPDLPGHGSTPPVRTGHYDPMSVVAIARWTLARDPHGDGGSTLVGVGQNAHGALVHAAGGGCDKVVVVDGLWGTWRIASEEIDVFYEMTRRIASDLTATGAPPASGLDPRATYGYGVMSSARFAERFWAAIDQPVLAIETSNSTTPPDERVERVAWFGGPATLVELDGFDPARVIEAIRTWC